MTSSGPWPFPPLGLSVQGVKTMTKEMGSAFAALLSIIMGTDTPAPTPRPSTWQTSPGQRGALGKVPGSRAWGGRAGVKGPFGPVRIMKITGGAAKDGPCPNPKALKPGDAETSWAPLVGAGGW